MNIPYQLQTVLARIEDCARDTPQNTQLIAVSKTKPISDIKQAISAGQRHFGENYLQEAIEKIDALSDVDGLLWHFIGNIQSNKTKLIAQHFDWAHAIDRVEIARRLGKYRIDTGLTPINVCLAVNIDNEPSKSGFKPENVLDAAYEISHLQGISLRGLMCIPAPRVENKNEPFSTLRALKNTANSHGLSLDTLSMGMSNDYCEAIAEGATFVRIGSDIFGARE